MPAKAIVLFGSGDLETNTTPPTGTLAGSGWDLQGNWSFYLGTPIGPHHFITASHLGGTVGESFTFRGVSYKTLSTSVDPASDFQIWEVAGTFPVWAELYDGAAETGLELVVLGRGMPRGAEVRVNTALKGWQWSAWDGRQRWGRNQVSSIINDPNHTGSELPQLLVVQFNSNATADEAHLGGGDSGGGVFIQQNGAWRLAGINFSVDGPYNTSTVGDGFFAAIFDEGGLYQGGSGKWTPTLDTPLNQAGSFYATRVKARLSWIQSVLAAPRTPFLVESSNAAGPFQPATGAVVDLSARTIRVTPTAGTHFYQIEGLAVKITSAQLEGAVLVLRYE